MGAIASQTTSLTIVYSTVYPDADQENIKAPRHWPLSREFTGDRWIPRTKGQERGKMFSFDDVIMISLLLIPQQLVSPGYRTSIWRETMDLSGFMEDEWQLAQLI